MTTEAAVEIIEHGHTGGGVWMPTKTLYFDHQPGDATRYEILAVDLEGRGIHLGQLGYISSNAILVVCGMGDGRAWLFQLGQEVSEFYVAEKFGLTNPHTVHHITELVAHAVSGTAVGCTHLAVRP